MFGDDVRLLSVFFLKMSVDVYVVCLVMMSVECVC